MARPRKLEREDVVRIATDVFWDKGYTATTVDDLDAATGMNRGSLYYLYGGKRELFLACLEDYARREIGGAMEILSSPTYPTGRIRALFMGAVAEVETSKDRRGCFLCNTAVELAPHDPVVETAVVDHLSDLRTGFSRALAREKPDLTARHRRKMADTLLASYAGLLTMAKAGFPVASLRHVAKAACDLG